MGDTLKPVVVCQSAVAGGAEAYLVRLYKALSAKGNSSALIGSIPGWENTGQESRDVKLSPKWGLATMAQGIFKLPAERVRVARAAVSDASLYHLQFKREQIGFTDVLSKRGPVVWTEHGRFPAGIKGRLLAPGYKAAAQKTSAIICVSDEVAANVRELVGPGPRIEVIPNAVDTTALRPPTPEEKAAARESLRIPEGLPVMLWIGRLHRDKQPGITTWLGSGWPGVVLVAGDGEMFDEINQAADEVAPNTLLLGHMQDTASLYRAADVMVFTSNGTGEGFPTTLIEAAAYGVPVLTNEDSGFAPVVTAAGGKAVPASASLERWIADAKDLMTGNASKTAREWSLGYDIKPWVRAHEDVFRAVSA